MSFSDPNGTTFGIPAPTPTWMAAYADLMTEMACFFLILFALTAVLNRDLQHARKALDAAFKETPDDEHVLVEKNDILISIQEGSGRIFFKTGSDALLPSMERELQRVAPTLRMLAAQGHEIMIEGHTDDVPILTSRFHSNWELSTARAANVLLYLTQNEGLPTWSVSACGYGENHPLVDNDSDEHRAMNRRVVFLIKSEVSGTRARDYKGPFRGPLIANGIASI